MGRREGPGKQYVATTNRHKWGSNVEEGVILVQLLLKNCRCPRTRKKNYLVLWKPDTSRGKVVVSMIFYWHSWSCCSLNAHFASISAHDVSSYSPETSQSSAVCILQPANSGIAVRRVFQPHLEGLGQSDGKWASTFSKDS